MEALERPGFLAQEPFFQAHRIAPGESGHPGAPGELVISYSIAA